MILAIIGIHISILVLIIILVLINHYGPILSHHQSLIHGGHQNSQAAMLHSVPPTNNHGSTLTTTTTTAASSSTDVHQVFHSQPFIKSVVKKLKSPCWGGLMLSSCCSPSSIICMLGSPLLHSTAANPGDRLTKTLLIWQLAVLGGHCQKT